MKKLFLSALCTLIMIPLFAGNIWDGSIADALPSNAGTADDPIQITTGAQLAYIAQKCNNGTTGQTTENYRNTYFKLMNDIDLNDNEWTPVGWHTTNANRSVFCGHFDGNGYTISNMKITALKKIANGGTVNTQFYGLFGAVSGGSITNLTVAGEVINLATANVWIAGVTGRAAGTTIRKCISKVDITDAAKSRTTANTIGGIVGYSDGATVISQCANHGDLTITLSGTGTATYNRYIGAVIAQGGTNVTITDCYNSGAVTISGKKTTGTWNLYIGSIAGDCKSVTNCFNRGMVSLPDSTKSSMNSVFFGTIIGNDTRIITTSYYLANSIVQTPTIQGIAKQEGEMKDLGFTGLMGVNFKQGEEQYPVLNFEPGSEPEKPEILTEPWDGTIAKKLPVTEENDGSSAEKPILIAYSAQLALIAKNVDEGETYGGKYFKLVNDLDLNNQEWTPIGWHISNSNKAWFEGNFDGAGYTIKNLEIDKTHYIHYAETGSNSTFYGLFGAVANGTIQNLFIEGAIGGIANTAFIGGVVGRAQNETIYRCVSSVQIDATTTNTAGLNTAGGIVAATVTNATVAECIFKGAITANLTTTGTTAKGVGGIIGSGTSGIIRNCYNAGMIDISGISSSLPLSVGGLAGGYKQIENSYNRGPLSVTAAVAELNYGPVVGIENVTPENTYYLQDCAFGNISNTVGVGKGDADMKLARFVELLNGDGALWTADKNLGNDGFARLAWEPDNDGQTTQVRQSDVRIQPRKVLYDGRLYILVDDKVYDILGQNKK